MALSRVSDFPCERCLCPPPSLSALCVSAFTSEAPSEALLARVPRHYCAQLRDDNPAVRRGVALALGALPKALLLPALAASSPPPSSPSPSPSLPLPALLADLIAATKPEAQAWKRDAEARRNAVEGLAGVVASAGMCVHGAGGLSQSDVTAVFDALMKATEDYATDNRGDVGSWVRRAAVDALLSVVAVVLSQPADILSGPSGGDAGEFVLPDVPTRLSTFLLPDPLAAATAIMATHTPRGVYVPPTRWLSSSHCLTLVQGLVRLAGEKLDLVRSCAGAALSALVHNTSGKYGLRGVPLLAQLRAVVPKDDVLNWAAAGECFPQLVRLLDLPPYVDAVLTGLVTSVGGLSESVVRTHFWLFGRSVVLCVCVCVL